MEIFISYNKKTDSMELFVEDSLLYEETFKELEELKDSLSADIEAEMTVDIIDKTIVCTSRLTDNVYRGTFKNLDADEICYCLHEVAVMDNIFIYIEEFTTNEPIIVSFDEEYDDDFDE